MILNLIFASIFIFALTTGSVSAAQADQAWPTKEITVDPAGPTSPWGKAVGDINGDGKPDLVIGGHQRAAPGLAARILNKLGLVDAYSEAGQLVWYQNPDWNKHLISTEFNVRTDIEVGDVDNDGLNDVVIIADQGVIWLKNPDWTPHSILSSETSTVFHDLELSDLDLDGDLDIVLRDQSLFGHENGNLVLIIAQDGMTWRKTILDVEHGEGLKVGDLDDDGYDDIVVNDIWLKNPGASGLSWQPVDYTSKWDWPDVSIDIHDINNDGAADILLSPAEPSGGIYRISWFESPDKNGSAWTEHIVDDRVESVHHFIGAGDFDGDGYSDIFSAEMNQGDDPDEVKVYVHKFDQDEWEKVVLATSGSHNMQVADFDGDGDAEVAGANWHIADYQGDYPVSVWDSARVTNTGWVRHMVGSNGPWHNLFVYAADLNGDKRIDIVAGRSWFENPGEIGDDWIRHEIGSSLNTALYVDDFDHDGAPDIFGTAWDGLITEPGYLLRAKAKITGTGYPGSGDGGQFSWAKNDGSGNFQEYENIEPIDGDYLQGISKHVVAEGAGLLLSWHRTGNGIQRIDIPPNPLSQTWSVSKVTDYSQDEQLSSIDVNGDGIDDVVTGTSWLDPAHQWTVNEFYSSSEPPDRHAVIDIDSDGALDAVIGYEAVSTEGRLALYRNIASSPETRGTEQIIDTPIGPMSLGAADMDNDGDTDLVVGEHNLDKPDSALLLLFSNQDGEGVKWTRTIISRGDEHHNGALLTDIDQDGDTDIVSIGWGHSNVLVFENLRIR